RVRPEDQADDDDHDPEQRIEQHADEIAVLVLCNAQPVGGDFPRRNEETQQPLNRTAPHLLSSPGPCPGAGEGWAALSLPSSPATMGSSTAASCENSGCPAYCVSRGGLAFPVEGGDSAG